MLGIDVTTAAAPAKETQAPIPVRDLDWVANRTRTDKGGTT
ncbi:hypothetical protein [Streptomyces sp. NA03103]|nr:hypothetical protein [Streptomyces sp. NA03103]